MTDTTTLDTTPDSEELPELVESERLGGDGTAEDTPLKTRVLLPLLVPLLSIVIVAVSVLNISRVFLAGDKDAALAMGIVITLAILVGASLLAAAPRLRTSSLAMILGGVLVVVVARRAADARAEPRTRARARRPATWSPPARRSAPSTSRRSPSIKFNADRVHRAGRHRAVQLLGREPVTPSPSRTRSSTASSSPPTPVDRRRARSSWPPARTRSYCTVPGHEAQGMKATLTVAK